MSAVRVEVGQVWIDLDPRSFGMRKIRIEMVGPRYALCKTLTDYRGRGSGRLSRINLSRFRPTRSGYRLDETT